MSSEPTHLNSQPRTENTTTLKNETNPRVKLHIINSLLTSQHTRINEKLEETLWGTLTELTNIDITVTVRTWTRRGDLSPTQTQKILTWAENENNETILTALAEAKNTPEPILLKLLQSNHTRAAHTVLRRANLTQTLQSVAVATQTEKTLTHLQSISAETLQEMLNKHKNEPVTLQRNYMFSNAATKVTPLQLHHTKTLIETWNVQPALFAKNPTLPQNPHYPAAALLQAHPQYVQKQADQAAADINVIKVIAQTWEGDLLSIIQAAKTLS